MKLLRDLLGILQDVENSVEILNEKFSCSAISKLSSDIASDVKLNMKTKTRWKMFILKRMSLLMPYDTFEKTKLLSTLSHSRQRQLIFWFIWFVWVKVEIFVTNFHLFLFWFPITFIPEIMIHGLNKINFLHHPQKDGKKFFHLFFGKRFLQ